ncbi:hypothetical protein HDU91_006871, partial [Kappamyces sp. JEL0680]
TPQESASIHYLWNKLETLKREASPELSFELVKQNADGSHQFDFMGEPVIKVYSNVTNIIVRLSCSDCSPDAILLNSHFDSTITTPGAADDASQVGIMMELLRLFSQRRDLTKSIIFLFNGAEETLQDATHAFVTQHAWAKNVKAVINLEAMGARGREILFQANAPFLVDAYAKAPRPHASSLSNDIFKTGLILSDTDFRQFVQYGNLVGLDFAFYQNSYTYHTNLDTVENIEPGAIQHFGDNIFAILDYLVTQIPSKEPWPLEMDSSMVYYDFMGRWFFNYSNEFALFFHSCVAAVALVAVFFQTIALELDAVAILFAVGDLVVNILVGLIMAVFASVFLSMYNTMAWFSHEFYPLLAFGLVFLCGMLSRPILFQNSETSFTFDRLERKSWVAATVLLAVLLVYTSWIGVSSSYVCLFHTLSLTTGLLVDLALTRGVVRSSMSLWVYAIACVPIIPAACGGAMSVLYVFVPITGRIGTEAPVDIIIPIVTVIGLLMTQFYLFIAVSYRASPSFRRSALRWMLLASVAIWLIFTRVNPYTPQHPKRLFVSFMENTTSNERGVHVSYADTGKQLSVLPGLERELETKPQRRSRADNARDWSTLYPFSKYVDNFYFGLNHEYLEPTVDVAPALTSTSTVNPNGTRTIHLSCHYTHFVWTVISFNAHVESWSLSVPPPPHFHHTIRHVGGDGGTTWTLDFTIKGTEPLNVEISGVERDGFRHLLPNSSPHGMKWVWSERWQSGTVLSRVASALPDWTDGLFVGIVVANHIVH